MNSIRSNAVAALAALLVAALPVAGSAQQKRTAAPAKGPTGAQPPAAVQPPAPAPVAAAAEPEPAPFEDRGPWRGGLVLGYEKDRDSEIAGPRVQLEAEKDLLRLGQRGQLSFVGAVAWFHGSKEDSVSLLGVTVKTVQTGDSFELVPGFRASFAPKPRLRLFGEIGVGAAWLDGKVEVSWPGTGLPSQSTSDDSFAGVLRLSAGGSWQVNDRLRLGVELPTVTRRYGKATSQSLSFSAMAVYAL